MDDLDHFDLVELVLSDHAPRVAAVAAGFGTETGSVSSQLDRQLVGRKNFTPYRIGQGHFRCRNQVKVFAFAVLPPFSGSEQVFREFGQLACSVKAVGIDHIGGITFGITVLFPLSGHPA